MNIAFLIDDSYSEQLAVTLASILKNDKHNTKFKVFVLDMGISEENKNKIISLKQYKDFSISFIPVNKDLFTDFPTIYHLKVMNYARLLLPSLVDCSKILFLDCDLLVLGDLTELYNTDFDNTYACVVKERLSNELYIQRQLKNLGTKFYFNAGVMLLNLDKMREDDIQTKSLDFARQHPERILLLDQCVLNHVFQDNVKFIDKKYNYQYKLNVSKKYGKSVIVHFVGKEKPYYGYAHPYENLYYRFLKLTPYKINFIEFKAKMWEMFYPRFKKRVCVLLKCMI